MLTSLAVAAITAIDTALVTLCDLGIRRCLDDCDGNHPDALHINWTGPWSEPPGDPL